MRSGEWALHGEVRDQRSSPNSAVGEMCGVDKLLTSPFSSLQNDGSVLD